MIELTKAYKLIQKDKQNNSLCHAYSLFCPDDNSKLYLKELAKIILCENNGCNNCRTCRLIDKDLCLDAISLFKDNILVDDIDKIVENTYLKPIENDKKVYIIDDFSCANPKAQNKILKTLEEPPNNVYFLLGFSSYYKVLDTVKSRVKKLEIEPFSTQELREQLKEYYVNEQSFSRAIAFGGGFYFKTKNALLNQNNNGEIALDIIKNLKKSQFIPSYSVKITKENIADILSSFKLILGDIIRQKSNQKLLFLTQSDCESLSKEFLIPCCIEIIEKITELEKNLFFNGNTVMVTDSVLFTLLEVKNKWQKLLG